MRKELLNHRPTSALRGQSPLCESVGTGHTSTHPSIFTKVLLVLLTTLLLPSTAWGQAITRTFKFDQTANQSEAFTTSQLAVSITETVGENTPTNSTGVVTITNPAYMGNVNHSVSSYSSSENGAVFTLTTDAVTEGHNGVGFFTIEIPGNYPKEPTQVALKIAYANSSVGTDNLTARISIGDYADNDYTSTATSLDETTLTLTATGGQTKRNSEGSLKIRVYLNGQSVATTTFTIKEVTITYTPDSYGLTIGGTEVTTENKDDVFNDGKVRFVPSYTIETITIPHTLTLNGATISGDGISWTNTDANNSLNIALVGANTVTKISGPGSPAPDLSIVSNGESASSLTIGSKTATENAIQGFTYASNPYTPPYYNGDTHMYWIPTKSGDITTKLVVSSVVADMFDGGDGGDSPFQISRAEQLLFVSYATNKNFILSSKTINCESLTSFEPIGSYSNPFIGNFNGNNCTIEKLTYSTEGTGDYVGLFGYVGNEDVSDAKIENLTLSNCSFNGGESVGGIVGEMVNGTIENCVLSSCTVKGGDSFNLYAGGIAGQVKNGTISTCAFNSGLVDGSTAYYGAPSTAYAGGIVGYIYSTNSVTVSSCTVSSTNVKSVTSGEDGAYNIYVGGLVGRSLGTVEISDNKITNTDNTKKISCQNINGTFTTYHCGAIIGEKGDKTTLTNNTYEYDVTTEIAETPKSGYTHRGSDAETDPSGISLYTQLVALPKSVTGGSITGAVGTYYKSTDEGIYVVPGKTATLNATPTADTSFEISWLQAVNATTTDVITPDSTSIDGGGRKYEFEMPDAQVNVTVKFAIDLASDGITATIANATCTGEALEPTTIAVEGITDVTSLTKDTDFTITGYTKGGEAVTSPIDVGTYTVSIKGKGDYTGTKDVSYTIEKGIAGLYFYHIKGDQEDPVQAVEVATYGTAYDSPRLKNPHNLPITFSCKAENSETGAESDVATIDDEGNVTILKAGTVYVYAIAAENDNYKELDKHYQLNIDKANLNNVTIANIADQTYTGSAITPELTVTTPDGTSVTTDDYGIGYAPDNTNVGEVTITLTATEGSEKFTGSTTTTFNIIPPTPTIAFDNTKTYLNTDKIAISIDEAYATSSATAGITNTIYYSWDENPVTGTEYSEGGVAAQTGTLTAWVSAAKSGTNYESEKTTQEFTVKTDISDYTVQGLATSATYTGAAIVPAFSVKASVDAETSLTLNSDYTVSYQSVEVVAGDEGSGPSINYTDVPEMVEVGSYRIVITGTGDSYGGSTYANFAITKADLSIVTIENIADQTYTGSEIKPEITVKLNGNTLSASDYGFSISYSNNINVATSTSANAPTVTITATEGSNYFTAGTTKVANFNIVQKSLTDESISVTLSASSFTYNGDIQYPEITVKDGETTLTSEAYGYSYSQDGTAVDGPATAGTYTLTIYGEGNYTGEITKEITITPKEIATADITVTLATTSYTFDGTEHKPEVSSVTISDVTDPIEYEDAVYTNNVNAALATATENAPTVTVSLKGNYSGTGVATFTIEQADLSDYVVTGLTTPTAYTGSPITPTFSVKATETAETSLTANTDYSVKYQQAGADVDEMKDAGDYKILITGEGNYKGSLDADFTIDRAQLNLTINLEGWAYGDTPNEPSLEGNLGEGDITWEYKAAGAEAYSAWSTLTTTTDAGTYMVKATVAETDNYEGGSKEAEFVIEQLDISQADITLDNNELTYNGEQQTVNVTKVMAGNIEVPIDCYEVSGNTGTEAGDYKLTVTAKTMDSSGNPIKNNFTGSAEKGWKIKNRTVTTAELGLSENQSQATYYSETEDLEVPEGVVAYIITGVNGNNVVTQPIRYIKKGVAVFVEQTTSTENPLEVIPDASELPLKGTAVDLNVASISGGTVYVLYKGEFVKSTTGTIPAKRCYLLLPNNVAAGTRAFGIIGGGSDGSTAIKSINDEPSTIDNWYDMGGHRIEKPTKAGLYIKNGKKVVIK